MSEKNTMDTPQEEGEMMVEVVTFVDDEGNQFDMEIIEEFEHKGKRYAVLAEFCDCEAEGHDHDHDHEDEESLYIFEIAPGENGEEDFLSIDDDELMGELSEIVEGMIFGDEDEEGE